MLLVDLLNTMTFDTVVNIVYNNEIIDSFKVIDFYYKGSGTLSIYNKPVSSASFINDSIVNVTIKDIKPLCKVKELTCFKDGSYMIDKKPFSNIGELLEYLIKCNY